jgi:hypothetical protein
VRRFIRFLSHAPLLAGMALVLAAGPLPADRVDGLYEGEGAFADDRAEAFADALAQVLVRITGRRDIAGRAEARALLDNAASYAQQFRQPAPGTLWVAFDGAALERALADAGLPVWGPDRPATLLWVAVDAGGGRRFVLSSGAESEVETRLRDALLAAAARRGIPVMFPLMDAEDRARASFAEVWGGFEDAIMAASARYGADAVLVGRVNASDAGFARWTLLDESGSQRWSSGLEESLDRVADLFAARFAVVSSGESATVRLAVDGVESTADYARVLRFLERLTAVESCSVERVEGQEVLFRLGLRGDSAALEEAIGLGRVLSREPPAPGEPGLRYRVSR